jgi:hypothetical protein
VTHPIKVFHVSCSWESSACELNQASTVSPDFSDREGGSALEWKTAKTPTTTGKPKKAKLPDVLVSTLILEVNESSFPSLISLPSFPVSSPSILAVFAPGSALVLYTE